MFLKKRLWRGLTSVFAFLLTFVVFGTTLANQYEGAINNFLGIQMTKVLNPGDADYPGEISGEPADTTHYKSDYGEMNEDNAGKLVEAGFDQTIQEEIEGAVLLMNEDNTLPLDKSSERISFFGHASVDPIHKGNSAGVDPMEGYRINFPTAFRMNGFELNEELVEHLTASTVTRAKSNYFWMDCTNATQGIADGEDPISYYDDVKSTWESEKGGTAIMVLTRCGQENFDMLLDNVINFQKGEGTFDPPVYEGDKTGRSSLALIQEEIDILEMLKNAKSEGYFDKIVVLLNTGTPMEVKWLEDYDVDACVWTGLIGGVGAHGVAKLLAGEANFSGRTVDTYASNSLSAPAVVNANENTQTYTNGDEVEAAVIGTESPFDDTGKYMSFQAEGIYVGYKYYETRYEDCVLGQGNADGNAGIWDSEGNSWNYAQEVSYPFGYGLSYTTFSETLDKVEFDAESDSYNVTVTVKNTGDMAGKHSVLVYAQTPYGDYERENKVEKSAIQLAGFGKTDVLQPGDAETLEIKVERYLLASYDYTNAKTYMLSEGDYYFALGDDVHDALNNIIKAKKPEADNLVSFDGTQVKGDSSKTYKFSEELDTTTYSTTETGAKVTNLFEDCDLNYWVDGAGTYLTRSDWQGTYPTEATSVLATPEMIEVLAGHLYTKPDDAITVEEATKEFGKDAGLILADMRDIPYDDEQWDTFVRQFTLDEMLNALDDAQGNQWMVSEKYGVKPFSLGDGVNGPNGCSIDMPYEDKEGVYGTGKVERISMNCFTGKAVLTGTFNEELYKERGRLIGEFGLWGGKQEFWTLGTNYHKTPFGGRNFEYCSEDPNLSYMALIPEAIEMEKKGVIACAKHPAGNDQETIRIGVSVFFNEQGWREGSLRASEGALRVADIKGYMQSYERLGLQSTMNKSAFNEGVVDGEWGFQGTAITDCTNARLDGYQGDYIDQIAAGTDRFCMTNAQIAKKKVQNYLEETDDGDYVKYIERAAKNYLYECSRSNMMNGMSADTIIVQTTPWWRTTLTILTALFAVLTAVSAGLLVYSKRSAKGKEERK